MPSADDNLDTARALWAQLFTIITRGVTAEVTRHHLTLVAQRGQG